MLKFLSIPIGPSTIPPQKIRKRPDLLPFSRTSGKTSRHLNMTHEAESVTSESDYSVRVGVITNMVLMVGSRALSLIIGVRLCLINSLWVA